MLETYVAYQKETSACPFSGGTLVWRRSGVRSRRMNKNVSTYHGMTSKRVHFKTYNITAIFQTLNTGWACPAAAYRRRRIHTLIAVAAEKIYS